MNDAYENALRTIADSYEAEVTRWGGRSLSRVATIVLSSGTFFDRVRQGKTFTVANLEKMAAWLRDPANWPDDSIPHDAALALISIGRPPLAASMPHACSTDRDPVSYDRPTLSQQADA